MIGHMLEIQDPNGLGKPRMQNNPRKPVNHAQCKRDQTQVTLFVNYVLKAAAR